MSPALALEPTQHALQQAICDDGAPPPPGLLHDDDGHAERRLAVYQDAYRARLLAALRDNYPVLQGALGDAAFDALGLAYIAAHPSGQPSIRWFGHRLAEFMAQGWPELPHPALIDLARMDWALRAAFDAADAPPLTIAQLQALPPEAWPALRFAAHPSVQLLALDWAIEPAWRALRAQIDDADGTGAEPALPAPEPLSHRLLIWRRQDLLETRWRSLPEPEATLLPLALAGHSFEALGAAAAEALGAEAQAAAPALVGLLQQWLADALLTQS